MRDEIYKILCPTKEITSNKPIFVEVDPTVDVSIGPGQTTVTLIPFWQSYRQKLQDQHGGDRRKI